MKLAKPDYYDPKLKGKDDGKDMENLPAIVSPPPKKASHGPPQETHHQPAPVAKVIPKKPVSPSANQSTSQSTTKLVDQPTRKSFDTSVVVGRPKAFYITKKQDEDLDIAVDKLNRQIGEKINQKIDRSTVIRLLLEEANLTSDSTVARLVKHLASRLISQLTG